MYGTSVPFDFYCVFFCPLIFFRFGYLYKIIWYNIHKNIIYPFAIGSTVYEKYRYKRNNCWILLNTDASNYTKRYYILVILLKIIKKVHINIPPKMYPYRLISSFIAVVHIRLNLWNVFAKTWNKSIRMHFKRYIYTNFFIYFQ